MREEGKDPTHGITVKNELGDEIDDPVQQVTKRPVRRSTFNVVAAQVTMADEPESEDPSLSTVAFQAINRMEDRGNLWLPINRVEDHFIYVCPEEKERGGIKDGTQMNRAVSGLANGIKMAQLYLDQGHNVQLRLLPGVYREQVTLPSGIALINHNIPRNLSTDEQRFWLTGGEENDHDEHVVLTLPATAEPNSYVIQCEDANDAVIAGIHFVGASELEEEEEGQALGGGLRFINSVNITVFLCHFVGHRIDGNGASISLSQCGAGPDERILFQDCLMEFNGASGLGGSIYSDGSALVLRGCALQANQASTAGGAAYFTNNSMPTLLEDCVFVENSVERPDELPSSSKTGWRGEVGHGGGIFVEKSSLHLRRSDMVENVAQGSGGAIYASDSLLFIEGPTDATPAQFSGNKALRGGAILIVGKPDRDESGLTALRANNTEFIANTAEESGGAIASFCLVHINLKNCGLLQNIVKAEHGEGGGLHANLGSRVKLTNTIVNRNKVNYRGSGLSVCNSSMRIFKGCTFTENVTVDGDAVISFYTTESQYLPDLRNSNLLEDPVICAVGPCVIRGNHAKRRVGGLYIGNYVKVPTGAIAYAILEPEDIVENTIEGPDGAPVTRADMNRSRPVDLLISWKGAIRNDGVHPPKGKRILR